MTLRCRITPELSDADGPVRPHWQLTWPARVRSSDFVGPFFLCHILNRVASMHWHPIKNGVHHSLAQDTSGVETLCEVRCPCSRVGALCRSDIRTDRGRAPYSRAHHRTERSIVHRADASKTVSRRASRCRESGCRMKGRTAQI